MTEHFFDDFYTIEPSLTIDSSMYCLREFFSILGFSLDPEKSQPPSSAGAILGVLFNTSPSSRAVFTVEPKPSRVKNLQRMIQCVLTSDELSPALAATVVGKFGFLCSTLFGRVGRCCTGALRARQYQNNSFVTPTLRTSLRLMHHFLDVSPFREVRYMNDPPIILYTDASDVPERTPRFIVGAVLFDPFDQSLQYSAAEVPSSTVDRWITKQSYMGQLELLACPFSLSTWKTRLASRSVLLFVDNDSAASNLVKGYSPRLDSAAIVGSFWLEAASLRLQVYIDRVESKSNLADGPSRFDFKTLNSLAAKWAAPNLHSLSAPSTDPSLWFGAPFSGGR